MRVATTVHKAGFEQYGHRWVEGIKNWPAAEFVMYAEGFWPPLAEGSEEEGFRMLKSLSGKRTEDLPRLQAFKQAHANYRAPSWEWDIVRFSNKVFAAYDAFYEYDGIGVWLDADCVTHAKIPDGYIESLLPEDFYMAQFNRDGFHTETGFWIVDCRHKQHKAFFDTWLRWFESGDFKNLRQWHDCTTLDATTRRFLKEGVRVMNLSGEHSKEMHPMALSDLGRFCDHTKGARKALGYSPENKFRKDA